MKSLVVQQTDGKPVRPKRVSSRVRIATYLRNLGEPIIETQLAKAVRMERHCLSGRISELINTCQVIEVGSGINEQSGHRCRVLRARYCLDVTGEPEKREEEFKRFLTAHRLKRKLKYEIRQVEGRIE